MGHKFDAVVPGNTNIVGVDTGAGYRIIVANEVAQLVQASDRFGSSETDAGGATEGAIKKRIPIRELLQSLQGNSKALGDFVMSINDMRENEDWPPNRVYWKKADIELALNGDPVKQKALEQALNIKLDGTPLDTLNIRSYEDGIIIVTPVTVTVNVEGKPRKVTGEVMEPYKPRILKNVEKAVALKPTIDKETLLGYYTEEYRRVLDDPKTREDVREALTRAISDETARSRAEAPERILRSAFVIVNENFIKDARYRPQTTSQGKPLYNLSFDFTDEGRKRLWQYSRGRVGTQLLLVNDGVAIAHARIEHELAQSELTITGMPNEGLVQEVVDSVKRNKGRKETSR